MYEIHCADAGMDCAFEIRSEDRDEVVEFARQHGREQHDMDVSREDALELVKSP